LLCSRSISNGMKLKKGDQVHIVSGKDKGKEGKILRILPEVGKIVVDGINAQMKHQRSRREGKKGEKVRKFMPLNASNVMIVCQSCKKFSRIGYKSGNEARKVRVCKKCQAEL